LLFIQSEIICLCVLGLHMWQGFSSRGGGYRDSPVASEEGHGDTCCPLQLMEDQGGGDIHTVDHGRPHVRAGGCALKDAVPPQPTLEQTPDRTCGPWKGAHTGPFFLAGPMAHAGEVCA